MRTRLSRNAPILAASVLGALLAACSSGTPTPLPANAPVTITTATPYAQPPAPTIVNSDGSVAGSSPVPGATHEVVYKLQAGDTVLALATRFGTTPEAIVTRNNITDPAALKIGQELIIPTSSTVVATATPVPTATATVTPAATPTSTATAAATATVAPTTVASPSSSGILTVYTVQKGDNSFDIAGRFGVSVEDLAAANGKTVAQLASIQIGDQLNIPRPR